MEHPKNDTELGWPYSAQEVRDKLASKIVLVARYWQEEERGICLVARMDGMGHSVGASLDGCSMDVCAIALAPIDGLDGVGCRGFEPGLSKEVARVAKRRGLLGQAREFAMLPAGVHVLSQAEQGGKTRQCEDQMLARWRMASWRWRGLEASGVCSEAESMFGLAISMASVFEGHCGWGGVALGVIPHPEDKEHFINRGGRYFEPMDKADPIRAADFGGHVTSSWVRRWADDGEPAQSLRVQLAAVAERELLDDASFAGQGGRRLRM